MSITYDAMGNVTGFDDSEYVDTGWDDSTTPASDVGSLFPSDGDNSLVQVGYFQGKIDEFQKVLIDVDARRQVLETLAADPDITPDNQAAVFAALNEYYDRRDSLRFVANTFNEIAGMANAVGASVPTLNIPSGLGFPPLAIPIGTAIVFTTAIALVSFAYGWLKNTDGLIRDIANTVTDPVKRAEILKQAGGGLFSGLGDSIKWIVIGGGVLLLLVALK